MKYDVKVQTSKERFESFIVEASNLQEAWTKAIRVSKCPVILNIMEAI